MTPECFPFSIHCMPSYYIYIEIYNFSPLIIDNGRMSIEISIAFHNINLNEHTSRLQWKIEFLSLIEMLFPALTISR